MSIGKTLRVEKTVRTEDSAASYGSGLLDVFSTPAMIALMEKSAHLLAKSILPSDQDTVGIEVNIKHLRATPVGMKVYAEAEISEIDGRKITFSVTAYDQSGEIGVGKHTRFIIDPNKFMNKLI
ncbi:Fluoroacetyl-CoA thioesterase [bioreactor metagenome]|mgnify:CR=1 FL=1|jgi:predicted thioesterase|uniref:Fluoroacetyl-CoA thioesterase n=1 Tax=bioreactor metagenome TaxID=1076179 RepID=A0A644UZK3_9ZZZZ|nr:thioesterase family protein [Bacteroidales bacterium]MBP8678087.1 thioesterase family protein [Bacteroidales bacterium]MBP9583733.1 thioesterase family protein [Bacteroidales bacterium]MBP9978052.1 thioesterase family protein [Bacteroidales bacterium]WRQ33344.1 thioesterase family protein [Bacteroidales bacterium MB20-C3-3]